MTICVVTRITPDHKIAQDVYTRPEPAILKEKDKKCVM
jgi:hypothetical protein